MCKSDKDIKSGQFLGLKQLKLISGVSAGLLKTGSIFQIAENI